ncbi:MAG: hypothetical protein PHV23_05295 [Candidatus Gracilibacteria bacterium]|nr:hypothetical protein [Candidatus Gracilibacteria bacterium]
MKKIIIALILCFISINGVLAYGGGNIQNNNYLLFDGKKIGPYEYISNSYKLGENGIQYTYTKKLRENYININGEDFGPYHGVNLAKSYNNGYVYSFYIEDENSNNGNDYLNVNGKIYGPFKKSGELVETGDNGYYMTYMKTDHMYINSNGKEYGPYDEINIDWNSINNNFTYSYKTNNKKYINIKGKNFGPYDNIGEIQKGDFIYSLNNQSYININGKDYGPYDKGNEFIGGGIKILNFNNNSYGFTYTANDKNYLNINGIEYGPYNSIFHDIDKYEGEGFGFRYINDNKHYININNKIYGPFNDIYSLGLLFDNFYSFIYSKDGDEYKCMKYIGDRCLGETKQKYSYINVNGKDYGPYFQDSVKIYKLGEKSYYFKYINNGEFLNINGKEFGPYKHIDERFVNNGYIVITKNNDEREILNKNGLYKTIDNLDNLQFRFLADDFIVYSYNKGDKQYININGKDYGDDYIYFNIKSLSNSSYIYSINKNGKNYINVDGKEYGPYDKTTSPENLIAVNGNYGFIYKINGKNYININGKEYGSYNEENYIHLQNIGDYGLSYIIFNGSGSDINSIHFIKNNIDNSGIKPNPSVDKLLNKIFIKIDKSGKLKSKKVYEGLIVRLDTLINKATTDKNKELLEYIKIKVEEKIK